MQKNIKAIDRAAMLAELGQDRQFDVVVIGGGATGLGIAVDAASRGLSTVIVDAQDFCAGTSSRSTKLIHGGVRYMRNPRDWSLVKEALYERRLLLQNAPDLVKARAFVLPCFKAFEKSYYALGLAMYSAMASGGEGIKSMELLGAVDTLCALPGIRRKALKGGVKFYDAQFDDARMAIALLHTAVSYGAVALNYAPAVRLECDEKSVRTVVVQDKETGQEYSIHGKAVFNCAGPWVDSVRRMADVLCSDLVKVSRGSHIMVDSTFMPADAGMFIPKTSDGRVLFCIPWNGMLEIGTTDIEQGQAPFDPEPTEDEIEFMIHNANQYLARKIVRSDVKASFTGLRPLFNPQSVGGKKGTATISREHAIIPEFGNMLTVTGGKWTSYRKMAEHAMTVAMDRNLVARTGCLTRSLPLLVDTVFDPSALAIEAERADDISQVKDKVCAYAKHAVQTSGARTAQDVLFRRLRLGQMNAKRTDELLPFVEKAVQEARQENQ